MWRSDPALRQGIPGGFQATTEERWAALAAIACPTLLLHGAQSELYDRPVMEEMAATIPDCRLVEIPGSTHRVQWHNPEAIVAAVQDFLGLESNSEFTVTRQE